MTEEERSGAKSPEILPSPSIAASAFVAEGAVVLGDVEIQDDCSIWFHCVIRGDTESISIGSRTNIQDGCVLHADPGFPCRLGEGVTVGHRAIVHGAIVDDYVMIGMGAIVLNGAHIHGECIIGAGAVITQGTQIPARSMVLGMPGRVVRELSEKEVEHIHQAASHYVEMGRLYAAPQDEPD